MKSNEARLWLRQAQDDHRFGKAALAGRFFAQACFVAQQTAEKAVKAVHYDRDARVVIGHSVRQLLAELGTRCGVTDELLEIGGQLDQYYIATRYPDALPGVAPVDAFTEQQARSAIRAAQKVLSWAKSNLRRT